MLGLLNMVSKIDFGEKEHNKKIKTKQLQPSCL